MVKIVAGVGVPGTLYLLLYCYYHIIIHRAKAWVGKPEICRGDALSGRHGG